MNTYLMFLVASVITVVAVLIADRVMPKPTEADRQRFQITLRNVMVAMFWFGVMLGCLSFITRLHRERTTSQWENPATLLMMVAPFIATGALLGRTLLGLIVGTIAITVFWVVFFMT